MKALLVAGGIMIGAATPLLAQPAGWTLQFSAGAAAPTSDISSRLSTGWGVDVGAGYQFTRWFDVLGEFGFAGMGVPSSVLQEFQAPDGTGRIFSLNVEPEVRFPLTRRLNGFVHGGVGWIRRTVELTMPSVQPIDYFDPFYGDVSTEIVTNQVLSSTTRNAVGGDLGGGVALPIGIAGADVFVDVRYYYAPTSPRVTAMVPVLFGIRYTLSK